MYKSARRICFLFLLVFLCCTLIHVQQSFAGIDDTGVDTANGETIGTNPKTRTPKVTATVRDNVAPDALVLISPPNGLTTNNRRPIFVWYTSSDAYGIAKYQLYIDGSLVFDNITPPAKNDSLYTYAESSGQSSLTLKNNLIEGSHTWKIRVYDTNDNYTDSATWSFTIDTSAPTLVVTHIGDTSVSVSAQDVTTIPTTPIVLYKNQPVISGTSEANATISISTIMPDLSVTTYTTTVASDGTWSITLGVYPYFKTIKLQITSKDGAQNTSLIDSIPIRLEYVTIKLPPAIGKIIPLPPEIVIVPPEVVKEEIVKLVRPYVPEPVVDIVDTVIPYSNSGIGFVLPLTRLLAVLWLTGASTWSLTLKLLERSAHAIGLAPLFHIPPVPVHTEGIVFDVRTKEPVPFALLTVFSHNNGNVEPVEEVVSHEDGTYETLHLKRAGSYSIVPTHRDYQFNADEIAKQFSGISGVYTGQEISSETCTLPKNTHDEKNITSSDDAGIECFGDAILVHQYIPMIRKTDVKRWHARIVQFAQLPNTSLSGVAFLMGTIALWSPTPWNIAMFLVYAAVAAKRALWA